MSACKPQGTGQLDSTVPDQTGIALPAQTVAKAQRVNSPIMLIGDKMQRKSQKEVPISQLLCICTGIEKGECLSSNIDSRKIMILMTHEK